MEMLITLLLAFSIIGSAMSLEFCRISLILRFLDLICLRLNTKHNFGILKSSGRYKYFKMQKKNIIFYIFIIFGIICEKIMLAYNFYFGHFAKVYAHEFFRHY